MEGVDVMVIDNDDLVSWLIDQVEAAANSNDNIERAAGAIEAYEHVINKYTK